MTTREVVEGDRVATLRTAATTTTKMKLVVSMMAAFLFLSSPLTVAANSCPIGPSATLLSFGKNGFVNAGRGRRVFHWLAPHVSKKLRGRGEMGAALLLTNCCTSSTAGRLLPPSLYLSLILSPSAVPPLNHS